MVSRESDCQGGEQKGGGGRLCMASAEQNQWERKGKKLAELNDGLKRGEWARTKRFVWSNHLNFSDDQSYVCQRYIT